jgi:pilus assembly protein Flp/PilA
VTRRGAARITSTDAASPQLRTAGSGAASREDAMTMLMQYAKSFVNQEEGQDLLEYALLVALIALVAVIAVTAAGGSVSTIFTNIANDLNAAAGS